MWQFRHSVSAYGAAYVALTEALSTVLVTGYVRLQRVPGLAVRIELAQLRPGRKRRRVPGPTGPSGV